MDDDDDNITVDYVVSGVVNERGILCGICAMVGDKVCEAVKVFV